MNYQRINDFLARSSLRGYVRVSWQTLVEHLGAPEYWDRYCPAQWTLEFEDGTRASIYVHKPLEHGLRDGEVPTHEFLWHVGGYRRAAVYRVAEALGVDAVPFGNWECDEECTDGPAIPF